MRITLGIATWNRCDILAQTLRSMAELRTPEGVQWEAIVCDNNSTDDTRQVVESMRDGLAVRYLFEPKQGKSHALNCLVDEADGDWVLFTDDDVRFEPDWIEAYVAGIAKYPDAVCLGGPVLPWLQKRADWATRYFLEHFPWVLSVLSIKEDRPMRPTGADMAFGNNMAVRRDVLQEFRFSDQSTMTAHTRGSEDHDLQQRVLEAGHTGWLLTGPKLHHYIPPQRSGLRRFIKWNMGAGGDRVATHGPSPIGRLGFRPWLWRLCAQRVMLACWRWRPSDPRLFYQCLGDALQHIGHARATDAMSSENGP